MEKVVKTKEIVCDCCTICAEDFEDGQELMSKGFMSYAK
jgi:hypothetical protein